MLLVMMEYILGMLGGCGMATSGERCGGEHLAKVGNDHHAE